MNIDLHCQHWPIFKTEKHGLPLQGPVLIAGVKAWISNYTHIKPLVVITHPCPNLSSSEQNCHWGAWISNYSHRILWDVITYPCPNFNEVRAWMSNHIPQKTMVCNYSSMPSWGPRGKPAAVVCTVTSQKSGKFHGKNWRPIYVEFPASSRRFPWICLPYLTSDGTSWYHGNDLRLRDAHVFCTIQHLEN